MSESEATAPPPTRLALLAVLATSGPRGLSRERLLGILWPEGDEERGRHALAQTVYSLRRELRNEAVIAGGTELRLEPSAISSDVGDFAAALGSGDHEAVARLYTGPFLDGFYLSDAPEFERWVEAERARLAGSAVRALEQLALGAEKAGHQGEALPWWRRLSELEPLRGQFAVGYITALAAAGDRAGALAHGRAHAALLKRELDSAPEDAVTRLLERLRLETVEPPHTGRDRQKPVVTDPGTPLAPVAPPSPGDAAPAPVGRRRAFALPVAGLVLAAVALLTWRSLRAPAAPTQPLLAVGALFDGVTRDSSGSGAVLTDMLATSLARIPGLQVVANSRLLELVPRGADSVPGTISAAARQAGAEEILEGELAFAPDGGLRLTLRRIDLVSGVVRQGYSVRAFDRYAAVDSATAAIAQDFGLLAPTKPIAEVSTSSPIAYRLYEEGLRAFYQYDAAAAQRMMLAALAEDSTFAMAAYYAWRTAFAVDRKLEFGWRQRAIRLAPRAPDRERLLILGMTTGQAEDKTALAPAESLTVRFPGDRDGQELYGLLRGERGDWAEAASAYHRAISLDSAASSKPGSPCRSCATLPRLFGVYSSWDSLPAAERVVTAWVRLRPDAGEPWGLLADLRGRQERWGEAEAAFRRVDSMSAGKGDPTIRWRAMIRQGKYEEVSRLAAEAITDSDPELRADARWVWLIALRNQGRLGKAGALATDGLTAAIIGFERGDYPAAIRDFRAEATAAATIPEAGHRARGVTWNLTHAGAAYAAGGDTSVVRRLADSVEAIGPQSLFGRSAKLHFFLRGLLLAAAGRHAEAVESYQRSMFSITEGYTRINYEMGKSLIALYRPGEAVAPLQAALRGGVEGSNLYITRTELHELLAQAFAAAGQRDSAAVHYREVVRAWEPGDPPFQVRRRVAQAWLAANVR